jgi:hypothetical protein
MTEEGREMLTDQDIAERAVIRLFYSIFSGDPWVDEALKIILEAIATARAEGTQDGIILGTRHSSDAVSFVLNKFLTTPLTRREP